MLGPGLDRLHVVLRGAEAVKYEKEVLEQVGSFRSSGPEEFAVVVHQPHLDPELTTIALDTPDGRGHELSSEDAVTLAEILTAAPGALARALRTIAAADDENA
jgi:hypothetical protein